MSAVAAIDIVTLLATAVAAGLLCRRWRAPLRGDVKAALALLLLVGLFRHCSNVLEWLGVSAALDPIEDFVEILEPLLFGAFLYAFLQSRSEGILRASEERYRTLVENIELGISLIDRDYRIVAANAAQRRLFGKPERALAGRKCHEAMAGSAAVCPQCPGIEAMATGRAASVEADLVRHDGSRFPARIQAFPVPGAKGVASGFIQVIEDLSERRRAEEERARLESLLRQSQKMEAVGQLAGGIAHDFNNILTAIQGSVELLLDRLREARPEDRDLVEGLRQIEESAQRAAALTHQLLAFSRREVLQPRVLDLNRTLSDMEKMLRRLITENIQLCTSLDPRLHRVRADADRLEQVIINLVVNARDAMPGGGTLLLETRNVALDDARLQLNADARPGPHVLLAVSDTGCGMDSATLERIFEPFFSTKPPGQGTGLGLSTVYGIVTQAGGHITVYSEVGNGTTFKIYLPAAGGEPQETAAARAGQDALTGHETILVCEDDAAVRQVSERILQRGGYTVLAAENGESALRLAAEHAGPIHLLVTDVIMPGMNGRELSAALCGVRPALKTLFVSGYTADVIAHHGVLEEGLEFLEKPFTQHGLLRRVRDVLDSPGGA